MTALTKEDVRVIVREETEHRFNTIDQRFDKVDQRFERVEQRLDNVEGQLHHQGIMTEENRKILDTVLEVVIANQKTLETIAPLVNRVERCELDISVLNLAVNKHVTDKDLHRAD